MNHSPALFATRSRLSAGSTVAETVVATAIASIGITGLCVASAHCVGIARAHRELLIADHCLQERTEQFRAANWAQLTDANAVQRLMNTDPASNTDALAGQQESVSVSAYPPVTPAVAPITATKVPAGTAGIVSQPVTGFYLRNVTAVRVDFRETWTSAQGKRVRTRETSTVIAAGGLLH